MREVGDLRVGSYKYGWYFSVKEKMNFFVISLVASLVFSFMRHCIYCDINDEQEKQFLVIVRLLVRPFE